jgi:hypothetical protein
MFLKEHIVSTIIAVSACTAQQANSFQGRDLSLFFGGAAPGAEKFRWGEYARNDLTRWRFPCLAISTGYGCKSQPKLELERGTLLMEIPRVEFSN